MLPRNIINELNQKVPYLFKSFGGLETYISYIKEYLNIGSTSQISTIPKSKYQNFINYFYIILKFSKNLKIISPWSFVIDLRDTNYQGMAQPTSINLEEPYRVYSLNGELIYSVAKHSGIFGESILDKLLINNSLNAQPYFLKYKQLNGNEIIRLLLINFYTKEVITQNEIYKSVDDTAESYITIGNLFEENIKVYILESTPIKGFTIFNLKEQGTETIVKPFTSFDIVITTGTYIYIQHLNSLASRISNNQSPQFLPLNSQLNLSVNPFYYAALNIDVAMVNRIFNQTLNTTSKRIIETIEIK